MEEFVKEPPRASSVAKKTKGVLSIEHKKAAEIPMKLPPSPPAEPPPEPELEPVRVEAHLAEAPPDLLGMDDPLQEISELDQKNAMALAVAPKSDHPAPTPAIDGSSGWELALVVGPSSNETATALSKLALVTRQMSDGMHSATLSFSLEE